MRGSDPFTLTLELARADKTGRPFEFEFASQRYSLRSAGGGYSDATFPWSDAVLSDLDEIRRPDRNPAVVQRLGDLLRSFLAPTQWPVLEAELHEAVEQGRPVVVTIRSAAAELYALPWELLTIAATGQHIGELPGVLVRYEWPDTKATPRPPSLPARRERLLFAWSGHVPASEHQASIAEACRAGAYPFDVEHDVAPHISCGQLSERLTSAAQDGCPITILHLLCHGIAAGTTFGLALDGDEPGDGVVAVDAARLRQILAPHAATLRLVVLAACDSGNIGALGNQIGSVAQALHRSGFAAVVASRFPLSTSGSNRLAGALYGELLGSASSLEHAFLAARAHVARDARQLDWAALQLYARVDDDNPTVGASAAPIDAPELREELSRFRALFSDAPGQIALLGRYKALHDVLQELEKPFDVIVRDHKRLLASPEAWDELRDPLENLQMLVEKTLGIMDAERLRDGFEASRRRLAAAKDLLDTAIGDTKKLDAAIHHVRRVLNLDTSSANTRLLTTARGLRLGEVVAALRSVVGNLERRRASHISVEELERLVASLDKLHTELETLLQEHDQWQAIGNDLRHLVDAGQDAVDEIQVSWPLVQGSLKAVLSASADWTRAIGTAAQDLDDALVRGGDARRWVTCLRSLYRRSNQRFVDVDKQLLVTCEALRGVGDTLNVVLKVIDDR
jgi:hypothetical protein